MTVSLERAPHAVTPCPPWCDGKHDFLYETAGEVADRDHFREIGRVNEGGRTVIVVGIAATRDASSGCWHDPCVELLHLDTEVWGGEAPELAGGDAYLTPAEALAIAPLLVEAAEILARWLETT